MNQDRYKSCFVSIIFFILVILVLLLFSITHSSCHTQKQCDQSATASAMAATVASQDLAAVERQRLDRTLTLQLDDLEIIFPLPDADGRFADGEMTDSVAGLAWQEAPSSLGDLRSPALLRAKRATIASAASMDKEDVRTAHLEDSTIRHEAAQSRVVEASERTAVAEPVPPWVYALAAGMAIIVVGFIWYTRKR